MSAGPAHAVRVRGLTLTAPDGTTLLDAVDLDVAAGEKVLLVGASGSGKSTLLRALAGLAVDEHDEDLLRGEVTVGDRATPPGPDLVGLLLQDPLDAVVAATTGRDTAFGPENLGLDRPAIWRRVEQAHRDARFPAGLDRDTSRLSGGELQRLAAAGALALRPGLLLLDEPTSMLDVGTAHAVRAALLTAAGGRTLVVVDHDFAGWAPVVDRVVVLSGGRVVADGTPAAVLDGPAVEGLWTPGLPTPDPLVVPDDLVAPVLPVAAGETALRGRGLGLVRRRRGLRPGPATTVLTDVDVDVPAGALTALRGDSGAGKSSLVGLLAGLVRPTTGTLTAHPGLAARGRTAPHRWSSPELAARVGWVPQHPEHGLVRTSVRAEVAATAEVLGLGPARADALLELLGLDHRADVDPHVLSGGEQRRLAVASALAAGPAVLLADEPTVGQDRRTWAAVTGLLRAAARTGVAVAVATHDHRFATDHDVHLHAGRRTPDRPSAVTA